MPIQTGQENMCVALQCRPAAAQCGKGEGNPSTQPPQSDNQAQAFSALVGHCHYLHTEIATVH